MTTTDSTSGLGKAQAINHRLPQVEQLLQQSELCHYIKRLSRPVVTDIIRTVLAEIRNSSLFKRSGIADFDVIGTITARCLHVSLKRQIRVINATGIALHTNLGRAPIEESLWQSMSDLNTGYCNLELDLHTGKRGGRNGLLPMLIHHWIGAEDALLVNNNAASVYLMLLGLAQGKEVIVSRGEQVQIGGGFRIPDILAMSGCKLVEVGTTNITTAEDYLNAITDETALVLIVHQSNFAIQGFTESADIKQVKKGLPAHVKLVVDQGSGLSDENYAASEASLSDYLHQGADLVCFSGDKIIGGPQVGVIAGNQELIARLSRNPMMRAFRCGRMVLALLEELLVHKLNRLDSGKGIAERTLQALPECKRWAESLAQRWQGHVELVELTAQVGGGSIPSETYPSVGLALTLSEKPQVLLDKLRAMPTPVIGYVNNQRVLLNLSSILVADRPVFVQQLEQLFSDLASPVGVNNH